MSLNIQLLREMDLVCDDCKSYLATLSGNIKERVLHHAVAKQHDKCMEVLLQAGADVNWDGDSSNTPLMRAAKEGYVDGVQRLIQAGADVNKRDKDHYTALILAGFGGHYECIELLLNAGADVRAQGTSVNTTFESALHAAVSSNNIRCVQLLLDAGADVNIDIPFGLLREKFDYRSYEYYSVISLASWYGHKDIVELLLKTGANVNETNKRRTALFEASGKGHYNVMELLIKAGADVNALCWIFSEFQTALSVAARNGLHEGVDLLIRSGADVNKLLDYGDSPLLQASYFTGTGAPSSHHLKCLELLIHAGADVNARTKFSALYAATGSGFSEGVRFLIQQGADVDIHCGYKNRTPLMAAVTNGQVGCTRALLEAGADVNSRNSEGCTALMCIDTNSSCVEDMVIGDVDYVGCAKLLLRSGAEIYLFDRDSRKALQHQVARCCDSMEYAMECADISLLLFAAGETLDGSINAKKLPDCLKFDDIKMVLKHICREAIRKHLLQLDPHTHLFGRVPRLGLPSLLTEYLLYNQALDDDRDDDDQRTSAEAGSAHTSVRQGTEARTSFFTD